MAQNTTRKQTLVRTDEDWRTALTADQYRVLRQQATEAPWSHPLNREHRAGTFVCAGCGAPLFESDSKFDSGCGWPSYFQPLDSAVETAEDASHLMARTEVHCQHCGGHLGHVFDDGPPPTGLRYCINGTSLKFTPKPKLEPPTR
ncbi:MAG TPA: peptide-methionine (R)-S-oxide reductase MsrB [Vicinamibacterales bacterium]|jgi:peptide-methionine (R)-S-oxide reductase